MTGKDVFQLQQLMDDSHVSDLVRYIWILQDDFTSTTLSTLLVDERPQLSSVMDLTVMFIEMLPAPKLFILTEATTKAGLLSLHYFLDRIRNKVNHFRTLAGGTSGLNAV